MKTSKKPHQWSRVRTPFSRKLGAVRIALAPNNNDAVEPADNDGDSVSSRGSHSPVVVDNDPASSPTSFFWKKSTVEWKNVDAESAATSAPVFVGAEGFHVKDPVSRVLWCNECGHAGYTRSAMRAHRRKWHSDRDDDGLGASESTDGRDRLDEEVDGESAPEMDGDSGRMSPPPPVSASDQVKNRLSDALSALRNAERDMGALVDRCADLARDLKAARDRVAAAATVAAFSVDVVVPVVVDAEAAKATAEAVRTETEEVVAVPPEVVVVPASAIAPCTCRSFGHGGEENRATVSSAESVEVCELSGGQRMACVVHRLDGGPN